ncbi:MAG: DUF4011 domain-containing protein, partial [Polyangiaceae bacterium]|nr:DUF4011 domain-containing protein [Polyangiaceae bacterium]
MKVGLTQDPRAPVLEEHLRDHRRRLLDLSNRNRLLNFKHSNRARTHIRVIDEQPEFLYRTIVEGRTLAFRAVPEPAAKEGRVLPEVAETARAAKLNTDFELPAPAAEPALVDERHEDRFIQTLHYPEDMERKLRAIQDAARTALEETGAPTLYGAFGFLEWYEDDHAQTPLLAPLLLHPLEIVRKLRTGKYEFSVTSADDETQTNITLAERLKVGFGLVLPTLDEGEGPEAYFAKVAALVAGFKRWRVRRFVTIGIFAFARLVMYRDLDPATWPSRALESHPLLLELFGGRTMSAADAEPPGWDLDAQEDAGKAPLLIADADSSQVAAIADALTGRSLVIQGPPGTGKSQTITNLIAAALASGKRVLFVAEKMAALHVVKKRLDDAQFGRFCLELHSVKARKKDVLAALRSRLEPAGAPGAAPELGARTEQVRDLRRRLNAYVATLRESVGASTFNVQQVFGHAERARGLANGLPTDVTTVPIVGATTATPAQMDEARAVLEGLRDRAAALAPHVARHGGYPWRFVQAATDSPATRRQLLSDAQACEAALGRLEAQVAAVPPPREWHLGDVRVLLRAIEKLPASLEAEDALVVHAPTPEALRTLETGVGRVEERDHLLAELARSISDPRAALRHVAAVGDLAVAAGRLSSQDLAIRELEARASALRSNAERALRVSPRATKLARVVGVDGAPAVGFLGQIFTAAAKLASTDRAVLLARTEGAVREESRSSLEAAARQAAAARELRDELAERIRVPEGADEAALRGHVLALRSAGFFAFFSSAFRAARALHRLWAGGAKHPNSVMADDFEAAADLVEARAALSADELRRIGGAKFAGADTDFALLARVAAFAHEVRTALPPTDERSRKLRDLVLQGDIDSLDAFVALATDRGGCELKEVVDAIAHREATDLEEEAARLQSEAALQEDVARQARRFGLSPEVRVGSLRQVAELLRRLAEVESELEALAQLPGGAPVAQAPAPALGRAVAAAQALHRADFDPVTLGGIFAHAPVSQALELQRALGGMGKALTEIDERRVRLGGEHFVPHELLSEARTLREVRSALGAALGNEGLLAGWLEYLAARARAWRADTAPLVERFDAMRLPYDGLVEAYDACLFHSLATAAYQTWPLLGAWSGLDQERAAASFRGLDRELLRLQQEALAARLAAVKPDPGRNVGLRKDLTGRALLEHELGKKKKHIPVRQLMERAGDAITALAPCFMMSPMSVAQFLPPGARQFDMVVVDEASQMRPEDALGSLARGRQLVVVGDPMQLPPTSFFDRIDADDEPLEDDDDTDEKSDAESILDLAGGIYRPVRDLRWHYRSRHESLIAYSNRAFY